VLKFTREGHLVFRPDHRFFREKDFADTTSAEAEVATEFFRRFEWLIERLTEESIHEFVLYFKTSFTLYDASREDDFEENARSYMQII
jgi:adenylate kinase family enzyme